MASDDEHFFMCLIAIGEVSVHIFCPFYYMIVCFVCVEFEEFFIDPGYQWISYTLTMKIQKGKLEN